MKLPVTAALFAVAAGAPQPASAQAWTLGFGTYFGGSDMTSATGVAVDPSRNVYVAGWTTSPTLPGCTPIRPYAGSVDAFVAKWDGATHLLDYCTFLGGSGDDRAFAIAVDSSGDVYVTGWTMSVNFPVSGALQPALAGSRNAFVTKLNPAGVVVYSSYLGGSGLDSGNAIAVDAAGNITVVGDATSANFPLSDPIQTSLKGQTNVFVTRLNPAGSALVYSTYLGGSGNDHGAGVALDGTGAAYLTGSTTSLNFPTVNAFQPASGGNQDVFVAKIGSTGSSLVYSTYLGGSGGTVGFPEAGSAIAVDSAGDAYVTGTTSSANFPLANALFSNSAGVGIHAFVTELNPTGSGLVFSTYLGGSSIDQGAGIAVDSGGNAVVAGFTASTDFPLANPTQASLAGSYDAFVARLGPSGTALLESTFLGGSGSDAANAVTYDDSNAVYLAGQTQSLNLPIENPTQPALAGPQNAFLAALTLPPQYAGALDETDCTNIGGWAWDANNPNKTVSADILDGATPIVTVPAGSFEASLASAGIGNGYHAFNYATPNSLKNGAAHSITVRISGTTIDLSGTPQPLTCAAPPVVIPSVHIDGPAPGASVSGTATVAGWAIDNASTVGTAISGVQVLVDGTAVGAATYGVNRPDVCAAYPGRPGCPHVGFSYPLNTAALTLGSHVITVTAMDSASPPDTGSASVTVTVTAPVVIPSVHIDGPAPGATVSGTATVSGWAIDNASTVGTAISGVQVLVDGTAVGAATYGVNRPDVCAAYPGRPGCPHVGFSYSLNTATLTLGSHTITVNATDSASPPDTGSASVTNAVAAAVIPSVHIDAPAAGAIVSGTASVSGWAIDNASTVGTAISAVEVLVDGTAVGAATYGINRPDVCAVYPSRPGCPNVGYTYSLNTAGLTAGSHTITVTATDSASPPDTGSASVTVTVTAGTAAVIPSVHIDAPAPDATISGTVSISGWAIDNTSTVGTAISGVQVLVDGTAAGAATYGINRPDVCAAYPGRPGCPNVGFTYSLNTAAVSAGSHTITVTATDSTSPPDTGSATTTVQK
ncbi:MAG: SBBP repeat-containing protein [Bryobacteraceae bacterium]